MRQAVLPGKYILLLPQTLQEKLLILFFLFIIRNILHDLIVKFAFAPL